MGRFLHQKLECNLVWSFRLYSIWKVACSVMLSNFKSSYTRSRHALEKKEMLGQDAHLKTAINLRGRQHSQAKQPFHLLTMLSPPTYPQDPPLAIETQYTNLQAQAQVTATATAHRHQQQQPAKSKLSTRARNTRLNPLRKGPEPQYQTTHPGSGPGQAQEKA